MGAGDSGRKIAKALSIKNRERPEQACFPSRFLKNRSRGCQTPRTPSLAFPNFISRLAPRPAAGIRVDA